jgi:hypothetical protein
METEQLPGCFGADFPLMSLDLSIESSPSFGNEIASKAEWEVIQLSNKANACY